MNPANLRTPRCFSPGSMSVKRIIDKEITLSEMCDVSADVTRVLDDLFGSGSYTAMIRGNMTEPDGIDIRIVCGEATVVVMVRKKTGEQEDCPDTRKQYIKYNNVYMDASVDVSKTIGDKHND